MFHSFKNQNERRAYGGSAFVELQYCKLKVGTSFKKVVSIRSIHHWQDDSLYIHADDIDDFLTIYHDIFQNVDCFGINYYSPSQLKEIITKVENREPSNYEILLKWLKQGVDCNGIYLLGI